MNRYIFTLLLLLFCATSQAQHLPIFTQYRNNIGSINPAAVNSNYWIYEHNLNVSASYRVQWVELENGPRTQVLNGSYLMGENSSLGWIFGGQIINDQTGPTGFTGLYGRVGGIITDDPYERGLSFGLSAGMVQYRVKVSDLRLRDQNDILTTDDQGKLFPDMGLGVFYYSTINSGWLEDSKVFGGLSVPQIFGLDLEFADEDGSFQLQRIQHFYGNLGLLKRFTDESFLETSAWLKYAPNAPVNVDINLRYQMASNFWLGAGGSTGGTLHVETGFLFGENIGWDNNISIGYGFDYSFSNFGPSVGSTHEINITYSLDTE